MGPNRSTDQGRVADRDPNGEEHSTTRRAGPRLNFDGFTEVWDRLFNVLRVVFFGAVSLVVILVCILAFTGIIFVLHSAAIFLLRMAF